MSSYVAATSELSSQYKNAANLAARQRIYRFQTSNINWFDWMWQQLDLPADAAVLELGCGNAGLWASAPSRVPSGWQITLSDISPGMLDDARRALADHLGRFHFEVADAGAIPHADSKFDGVIANHMLYHVADLHQALGELRRVLKPGGSLFAATNSSRHLSELRTLLDRHIPQPADAPAGSIVPEPSFRLDRSGEDLAQHFRSVQILSPGVGKLRVTDADAIVDYALSIERAKPVLVGTKLETLRNEIADHIRRHGSFDITTESGIFRCLA
jgi:ubiquinone/menaquinone biosynthesis C-methylase UbiE